MLRKFPLRPSARRSQFGRCSPCKRMNPFRSTPPPPGASSSAAMGRGGTAAGLCCGQPDGHGRGSRAGAFQPPRWLSSAARAAGVRKEPPETTLAARCRSLARIPAALRAGIDAATLLAAWPQSRRSPRRVGPAARRAARRAALRLPEHCTLVLADAQRRTFWRLIISPPAVCRPERRGASRVFLTFERHGHAPTTPGAFGVVCSSVCPIIVKLPRLQPRLRNHIRGLLRQALL
jgi:hypothetical protein